MKKRCLPCLRSALTLWRQHAIIGTRAARDLEHALAVVRGKDNLRTGSSNNLFSRVMTSILHCPVPMPHAHIGTQAQTHARITYTAHARMHTHATTTPHTHTRIHTHTHTQTIYINPHVLYFLFFFDSSPFPARSSFCLTFLPPLLCYIH